MLWRRKNGRELRSADALSTEDADIWAMRDLGLVRASDIAAMREKFGVEEDIVADYDVEPSVEQKASVVAGYAGIADHLNAIEFDEQRDWTPRQAWSLGRAKAAIMWGVDPVETILPVPWR